MYSCDWMVMLVNNEVSTLGAAKVLFVQLAVICHREMRRVLRKRRQGRLAKNTTEVAYVVLDLGIACLYGNGLWLLLLALREGRSRIVPITIIL